ncbi:MULTISPECIES: hypothetical protein [Olivibacter]|uniref:Uncharacterized protein n=1 Tax=Olivibacter jilunii TaxID=985016 RepID=A0ABW6B408_9SPHI
METMQLNQERKLWNRDTHAKRGVAHLLGFIDKDEPDGDRKCDFVIL